MRLFCLRFSFDCDGLRLDEDMATLSATDECADGELVATRSQVAVKCDRVAGHVYLTLSPRVICGTAPSPGVGHLVLFSRLASLPQFC